MSPLRSGAKAVTRWLAFTVLFAGVVLCGSGCLEFEQIVFLVFSKDRDEVRALLVYERLDVPAGDDNGYVIKKKGGPKESAKLDSAERNLAELFTTDQVFYFGSNFFEFSLKDGKHDRQEEKDQKAMLRKHLTIRKGSFFINEEGRLCGYQTIVVRNAQKLLETLNEWISWRAVRIADEGLALDRSKLKPDERKLWADWDTDLLRVLRRAGREKHQWLRLNAGRLSFTLPGTPELFARVKRRFYSYVPTLETSAFLTRLSQSPWSIDERRDRLTISIGAGDWEPFQLSFGGKPKAKSKYHADLIKYAKTLGVGFKENLSTKSSSRIFGVPELQLGLRSGPRRPCEMKQLCPLAGCFGRRGSQEAIYTIFRRGVGGFISRGTPP